MKKSLILILFLCLWQATAFAAVVKPKKEMTLEFTLNYKVHTADKTSEREMKNALKISGNQWHIAGKYQSKNDEVLLLLVKMLTHHKSKFTFQFLIVDSDNKHAFVTEPKVTIMAGLPTQQVVKDKDNTITINSLLRLSGSHPH